LPIINPGRKINLTDRDYVLNNRNVLPAIGNGLREGMLFRIRPLRKSEVKASLFCFREEYMILIDMDTKNLLRHTEINQRKTSVELCEPSVSLCVTDFFSLPAEHSDSKISPGRFSIIV